MNNDPDLVFLTTYACRNCRVELVLPQRRADSWLRCPRCGRPGLPPTFTNTPTLANLWGSSTADPLVGGPATPVGPFLARLAFLGAGFILFAALVASVATRLAGVDDNARMIADSVAFLAFGAILLLGLRSSLRS